MKVYLIRHARTDANEKGQYVGRIDIPISDDGRKAAESLTPFADVKKVYVSPMIRTKETAGILFPNSQVVLNEGLKELDFGHFEGKSYEDMKDDPKYTKWVDNGALEACPGGEDPIDFGTRVYKALMEILEEAQENGEDTIYVVTHGGVIMSLIYQLQGCEGQLFDYMSKNCGGWSFEVSEGIADRDIKITGINAFADTDEIGE